MPLAFLPPLKNTTKRTLHPERIVAIAAGWHHTVGLKSDGTVVVVGENASGECKLSAWTDME